MRNVEMINTMMAEIEAVRDSGKAVKQKGGKLYTMVQDRVETLRRVAGDYYRIETQVIQWASDPQSLIVVRAIIRDEGGMIVATGHAEEVRGSNYINETSALENCETSAVGRALAVLGIHGGEFASADEIKIAQDKRAKMGEAKAPEAKLPNLKLVPTAELELKLEVKEEEIKPLTPEETTIEKAKINSLQLDLEDAITEAGGPARPLISDAKIMNGVKESVVECVERIDGATPVLRQSKDFDMLEECFATFIPLCSTVDEAYSFWHKNELHIQWMKTEAPEHFERVRQYFTSHKSKLTKKAKK